VTFSHPTCKYCWTPVEKISYAEDSKGEVKQAGRGKRAEYKHKAGYRTTCTHNNLQEFEVEFGEGD
jgi:hypothetical protein